MNKSDLLPIEKTVQHHLDACFPQHNPPVFVIGVSGGADSMALLHVLKKLGVELHVVHINYQKRGGASEKDARLVQQAAHQLNLSCKTVKVDPSEAQNKNFQQWARETRYQIFEMDTQKRGADGIAVAHHEDDQIETILQKIFRGSGLASWSAMQVWDGRLFRPLLSVSKESILQYCRSQSIAYRTDASNLTSDYARNFLRNEWLPAIGKHFPGWRDNILRITEQARIFESTLAYILKDITDKKQALKRDALLELELELQKSVLLYQINQRFGNIEVSRSSLKQFESLGTLQTGKALQLTEQLQLMRDRSSFRWVSTDVQARQSFTLTKEQLQQEPVVIGGITFALQHYHQPNFEEALYLDSRFLQWPLTLRNWRQGDRFQPFGMQQHQSVADHLTNRKISAVEKHKALVLETFDEMICTVIFPATSKKRPPGTISERLRCHEETPNCLMIKRN